MDGRNGVQRRRWSGDGGGFGREIETHREASQTELPKRQKKRATSFLVALRGVIFSQQLSRLGSQIASRAQINRGLAAQITRDAQRAEILGAGCINRKGVAHL